MLGIDNPNRGLSCREGEIASRALQREGDTKQLRREKNVVAEKVRFERGMVLSDDHATEMKCEGRGKELTFVCFFGTRKGIRVTFLLYCFPGLK